MVTPRGATGCGGIAPRRIRDSSAHGNPMCLSTGVQKKCDGGRRAVVLSTKAWASGAPQAAAVLRTIPPLALKILDISQADGVSLPKRHRTGGWQPIQQNSGKREGSVCLCGAGVGATWGALPSTRRGCAVSAHPTWPARLSWVGDGPTHHSNDPPYIHGGSAALVVIASASSWPACPPGQ